MLFKFAEQSSMHVLCEIKWTKIESLISMNPCYNKIQITHRQNGRKERWWNDRGIFLFPLRISASLHRIFETLFLLFSNFTIHPSFLTIAVLFNTLQDVFTSADNTVTVIRAKFVQVSGNDHDPWLQYTWRNQIQPIANSSTKTAFSWFIVEEVNN